MKCSSNALGLCIGSSSRRSACSGKSSMSSQSRSGQCSVTTFDAMMSARSSLGNMLLFARRASNSSLLLNRSSCLKAAPPTSGICVAKSQASATTTVPTDELNFTKCLRMSGNSAQGPAPKISRCVFIGSLQNSRKQCGASSSRKRGNLPKAISSNRTPGLQRALRSSIVSSFLVALLAGVRLLDLPGQRMGTLVRRLDAMRTIDKSTWT
mmetsp:Transcript_27829/g.64247  ORF Transcript_27829/g.64247 Transcript_27829/m.64247 type:complete len:210 (+) Transcript_27829:159-788(+)